MTILASSIKSVLARAGFDIERARYGYAADRAAAMRSREIDLVIDVGANEGQYARSLRACGYGAEIVSLEPLPSAFERLRDSAATDRHWQALPSAVGDRDTRSVLHVSRDGVCSSLTRPQAELLSALPQAEIVEEVDVEVVRLDGLSLPTHSRLMLKLDVQGFERSALEGASGLLGRVQLLELELALQSSYEETYHITDALPDLRAKGFEILSLGRGATNPATGRLIDVDVLLGR